MIHNYNPFPIRPLPRDLFHRRRRLATHSTVFLHLQSETNPKPLALTDTFCSFHALMPISFFNTEQLMKVDFDDQRTSTPPPVPWIHVNYNKPDPQVCDDTNEKSSLDGQSYDTKRKRKSYILRLRNKHRFASSIRVVRHARAPAPTPAAPAQAPAPALASTPPPVSIFRSIFKKQNKDKRTHPDTGAPTPPPPPRSFLNNIFKPGNKNKKLFSSKTSPLPRSRPQPRPPPQPKPQPQHYYRQSSVSSSSQSSYIPQPPPLPPFDKPANKYKYIGQYFVRLRRFNSNTSSSPDLQPMGQPSTSMDSGDML
ncbi:hypothetical protein Tco_1420556 [Tanacetum coccineum]